MTYSLPPPSPQPPWSRYYAISNISDEVYNRFKAYECGFLLLLINGSHRSAVNLVCRPLDVMMLTTAF